MRTVETFNRAARNVIMGVLVALFVLAPSMAVSGVFYVGAGGGAVAADTYANCVSTASGLCATDGPLWTIDGAPYLPGAGAVANDLPTSGWTTVTGTPNQATEGGCQTFDAGATVVRIERAAPATPYTVMIGFSRTLYEGTTTAVGYVRPGLSHAANDDVIQILGDDFANAFRILTLSTWSTAGGLTLPHNPTAHELSGTAANGWYWFRMGDTGANLEFESCLGPNGPCEKHYTVSRTAAPFAAGAPDSLALELLNTHAMICHWDIQ